MDLFLPAASTSICSAVVLPPLRNLNYIVSITGDFPQNSKGDADFPCTAYDCSPTDCGGLLDYLRDVPFEKIFKLDVSAAATLFMEGSSLELMYIYPLS